MAQDTNIQFTGFKQMADRIRLYRDSILRAVKAVAKYWAAVFEKYAKTNAPWTDRTGNARQSLHTFVEELSNDSVKLFLSHGVEYGKFLESKYAGRYAIIWPTIQRHLPQIRAMLQRIFS